MTFEVVIEQPAHSSIERNATWWATNHSVEEAIAWKDAIYEQLEELQSMPGRHGLAHENEEFPFELRQQLLGTGQRKTYRALFTIRDRTVHVLEFLAAEQDDWKPST
jgi:plasmid stabilization system protein ParE